MKITVAVMEKADGLVTRRAIRLDEVLVKVSSCGVCGTHKGCIHGLEPFPAPGVLGHEGAGVVEEVGAGVTSVRRGDRVMIGFPYCGTCRTCRRGEPRYCVNGKQLMVSGYRMDGSTPLTRGGEKFAGRFPVKKLAKFCDFADINRAIDDSDSGTTVKLVVRTC